MTADVQDEKAAQSLSASQRKQLRALAHHLEPIIHVGHAGVTEGVVEAAARALLDHELIKVRLHEPEDKRAMARELAARTQASLCGLLGHTVILYRRHPKRPQIAIEWPGKAASHRQGAKDRQGGT